MELINDEQVVKLKYGCSSNWWWAKWKTPQGGTKEHLCLITLFRTEPPSFINFRIPTPIFELFEQIYPDYRNQGITTTYIDSNHYKITIEHFRDLEDERIVKIQEIFKIKIFA